MIVGLTGKVGSGKDTAGHVLVKYRGFTRVSFAEPLRQCVLALDPIIERRLAYDPLGEMEYLRLSWFVTQLGWDESKKKPEVRRLLQRMGTEAGRNILGQSIWVDLALRQMQDTTRHYVVTDCRFVNEAAALRSVGAVLWRVDRPGAGLVGAAGAHPSEVELELIQPDLRLINDSSLEALEGLILAHVDQALRRQGHNHATAPAHAVDPVHGPSSNTGTQGGMATS